MKVRIAIGDNLLDSLLELPKSVQKKVNAFMQMFRKNPRSGGINYEKFNSVDPNLRSVRIDQDYRGIVLAPASGNVYVLLWVAHHDNAYAWGKTRRVEVNPATGSLQIYDTSIVEEMQPKTETEAAAAEGTLFRQFKDKELMSLGVPKALIPLLRPLDNVLGEDERILFTTFTKNLAIDIRENLAKLCSADQLKRVEVVNIHAWVDNFLRANGREFNVHYPGAGDLFWKRALAVKPLQPDLPDSFYRDEWEQVLQPEGITDLASYLNVARTGRGTRLTARDRQSVWTVFEEYRRQLEAAGKRELIDAVREARMLIETLREGQEVFGDGPLVLYRSIVVDEAQDMSAEVFRLLRAMLLPCENDLFIVGDAHQRIYGSRVVLGRCGIEIRGRSRTLRVNYRTTDETCRWAVSLLEGIVFDDLDEGTDDQRGYRSLLHGDPPMVRHFDSFGEETDYIRSLLADIERQGMPLRRVCLVARTKKDRDRYSGALEAQGVPVLTLEAETEDDRSLEGLRVATMHRVKGLEFEHMIIAGMSARNMPAAWMLADAPDAAARERIETMERSLLYVATTRARRQVYITGYGTPSKYLE